MKTYSSLFVVECMFLMFSTTVTTVSAATWRWTVAKNLCFGIIEPCTSGGDCTTVGFGPCEGSKEEPTAYLKGSVTGAAVLKLSDYLSCADPENCAFMKVLTATGAGFRDFSNEGSGATQFAYTMTGNAFGDLTDAGAYLGVSSYVNTGTGTIETIENKVYVAGGSDTQAANRVTRGNSKLGAPSGPYRICIADTKETNGACTKKRLYEPGEYKFSIYGYTAGPNYDTKVVSGQNGFPLGMDHLCVRAKLSAVGFTVNDVKVNGNAYSDDLASTVDVSDLSLCHASGCIDIKFPKEYNIGSSSQFEARPNDLGTVNATKEVKIRVHGADAVKKEIFIDYCFETATLKGGTYFIYDPTVSEHAADLKSVGMPTKVNLIFITFAATFLSIMLF